MKKMRESYKLSKKEQVADSLKLPKDIIFGSAVVTMTGMQEAYVENYRGILEYTKSMIMLQTKTCQICFEGKNLSIDYYTNDEMKITGYIEGVHYIKS